MPEPGDIWQNKDRRETPRITIRIEKVCAGGTSCAAGRRPHAHVVGHPIAKRSRTILLSAFDTSSPWRGYELVERG